MRIRELSQRTGVQVETIRFYERSGVLPPARRAPNGYRVYDETDVERLRFIRGARQLGISLEAIGRILRYRDEGIPPCDQVQELLAAQIAEVEARIAELERVREELRRIRDSGASLPDDVVMENCVCGLISRVSEENSHE